MWIIVVIGWVFITFLLYGFGVIEPMKKKAIREAYALLKEEHPDPEAVKKAIRAFVYPDTEAKELIHRLMTKISP